MAAWVLAGGEFDQALGLMLVSACFLYLGGTTLNDFFDAAFDREYRQERPIPQGIFSRRAVGIFGFGYLVVGAIMVLMAQASPWFLLGLLGSILLYDYWHKRWVGSVYFMGACRAFLVLLAASSVSHSSVVSQSAWLHAVVLMAYIVGLTFIARGESRDEPLCRWPLAWLFLPGLAILGIQFSLIACVGSVLFLAAVITSLRMLTNRQSPKDRIGRSVSLLLASICLIDAGLIATDAPMTALLMLGCFGLALLAQRFVPAT